ncbi:hypothetical protein [Vibrio campbellii]|uniref:hypothetical protein n=1 Tax=Vibrio campbellii TaxID=680 RepID=UPI0040560739|nr:hypothetical protein [Vibrio vulnificus]
MSESAATIIKILSALTSPKASIKYLSVGIFMLIAWGSIQSVVDNYGVPSEHRSIIALFIGLGAGSLIGHSIYLLVSFFFSLYQKGKKHKQDTKDKALKEKKEKEAKLKSEKELLSNLEKSYPYYDYWMKDVLRKLSERDMGLEWSDYYVKVLVGNGYIQKVLNIDNEKNIYKIHPSLKSFVQSDWESEIESTLAEFYRDYSEPHQLLIKLLEFRNQNADFSLSEECIGLARLHRAIFDIEQENENGMYISVASPYYSRIEQKLSVELSDETYVDKARISVSENVA